MTSARSFDAIVIGAGPAGEVAAGKLADRGLATALVERELVGGECSFYACMPSKALLRPSELADETRRVQGVSDASVETIAALRRRDEVIHDLDDSIQLPWVEKKGIALLRGSARARRRAARRRDAERRSRGAAGGDAERSCWRSAAAPRSRRSLACASWSRGPTARSRPRARCRRGC